VIAKGGKILNRTVLAVLLFGLPIAASATAIIANCGGVVAVPVGNSASCEATVEYGPPPDMLPASVQAQASLSFGSSFSVSVDALESPTVSVYAEAEVLGSVNVLVTGATGAGFLEPCGSGSTPDADESEGIMFGGISVGPAQPLPGLPGCETYSPQYGIPIVFGVPQVEQFSVQALSSGLGHEGEATLTGFVVYDAAGNPVSDATVTVTDAPEPSAIFQCIAGLCLFYGTARVRRRRFLRQSSRSMSAKFSSWPSVRSDSVPDPAATLSKT
jgi:hypothetical protein